MMQNPPPYESIERLSPALYQTDTNGWNDRAGHPNKVPRYLTNQPEKSPEDFPVNTLMAQAEVHSFANRSIHVFFSIQCSVSAISCKNRMDIHRTGTAAQKR
jgi:hypothetical protein